MNPQQHGQQPHNKNNLKSDNAKKTGNRDQYGSDHNQDKQSQHKETPAKSDLNLRESAQDIQPDRGLKNKSEGNRSSKRGKK